MEIASNAVDDYSETLSSVHSRIIALRTDRGSDFMYNKCTKSSQLKNFSMDEELFGEGKLGFFRVVPPKRLPMLQNMFLYPGTSVF